MLQIEKWVQLYHCTQVNQIDCGQVLIDQIFPVMTDTYSKWMHVYSVNSMNGSCASILDLNKEIVKIVGNCVWIATFILN